MNKYVFAKCIKIENFLQIRIIDNDYKSKYNCLLPNYMFISGKEYCILKKNINLHRPFLGKPYYKIHNIKKIKQNKNNNIIYPIKIYTDKSDECQICLDNNKNIIINPCGHYYFCDKCLEKIKRCPICKTNIISFLNSNVLEFIFF